MPVTVTDRLMRGTETRHTARRTGERWAVSWLPGRVLSHDDAGTAMIIAETVGDGIELADDRRWPAINAWAAELGLSGTEAVARVSRATGR
jgi:hypothetical protein